jgi:hypothetical protein
MNDEEILKIKNAFLELRNIMEEFIGSLHDAVATNCLVPPSRSPSFQEKLIGLINRLVILEMNLN